jgi:hypothetical protein
MKTAVFKPTVPSTAWPNTRDSKGESLKHKCDKTQSRLNFTKQAHVGNEVKAAQSRGLKTTPDDEYGIDSIDDSEMLKLAERIERNQSDEIDDPPLTFQDPLAKPTSLRGNGGYPFVQRSTLGPARLPNGRYQCRHACKDKSKCKHMCCREGLDLPPKDSKKRAKASTLPSTTYGTSNGPKSKDATIGLPDRHIEAPQAGGYTQLDLSHPSPKANRIQNPTSALKALQALQEKAQVQRNRPNDSTHNMQKAVEFHPIFSSDDEHIDDSDIENAHENHNLHLEEAPYLDGDEFKDVDELSDLPNLSDVESMLPNISRNDLNPAQSHPLSPTTDELAMKPTQQSHSMEVDHEDFTKYVDWDDYYINYSPSGPLGDTEKRAVERITPGTGLEGMGSRKRTVDNSKDSPLFVHDSAETFNRGHSVMLAKKRPRCEKGTDTQPLKEISQAPLVTSYDSRLPEMGSNSKGLEESTESPKNDADPESEVTGVDIEWLLREFGTCVEFV